MIKLLRRSLTARTVFATVTLSAIALAALGGFLSYSLANNFFQNRLSQVLSETERAVSSVQGTVAAASLADETALQTLINSVVPSLEVSGVSGARQVALLRSPGQPQLQLFQSPISQDLDLATIPSELREEVRASDGVLTYTSVALIRNGQQAIIFDTPTDDKGAKELIRLVQDSLYCKVLMVIPTHFHNDCLGGLQAFHDAGIPSIANELTLELAKNSGAEVPKNGFRDSLTLEIGSEKVWIKFLGQGHTRDNVVGYFPGEKVLFGGCLIKEIGASKGYLGDANVEAWSRTVKKVKKTFPHVKHVLPGHGQAGDSSLLDYTWKLFAKQN